MYEFINTCDEILELKDINNLVEHMVKKFDLQNSIFNIIIVDNEEIRKINKEYRNKDSVTDVISFALEDVTDIKLEVTVLGDIYISIDKAKEQALEYNHSLLRELSFLTVHGLLHLMGYDHMNDEDEKVMFKLQDLILDELKISRGV